MCVDGSRNKLVVVATDLPATGICRVAVRPPAATTWASSVSGTECTAAGAGGRASAASGLPVGRTARPAEAPTATGPSPWDAPEVSTSRGPDKRCMEQQNV